MEGMEASLSAFHLKRGVSTTRFSPSCAPPMGQLGALI